MVFVPSLRALFAFQLSTPNGFGRMSRTVLKCVLSCEPLSAACIRQGGKTAWRQRSSKRSMATVEVRNDFLCLDDNSWCTSLWICSGRSQRKMLLVITDSRHSDHALILIPLGVPGRIYHRSQVSGITSKSLISVSAYQKHAQRISGRGSSHRKIVWVGTSTTLQRA